MQPNTVSKISDLESLYDAHVIVYMCANSSPSFQKIISEEDVPIIYECLRRLGKVEHLALVLHTGGGYINPARRIALLFREFSSKFSIFVPYKARSAATLLCLVADQIIMGPLSELSPIDPYIVSANVGGNNNMPPIVSSEDVRVFREMAEEWFNLRYADAGAHIFNLLGQRFFPTTLTAFYRSDKQVRQIAHELLSYQLPFTDKNRREKIINQLITGYYSHDYSITRSEAKTLGLNIKFAEYNEEELLWNLLLNYQESMNQPDKWKDQKPPLSQISAIISSSGFTAHYVTQNPLQIPPDSTEQGSYSHQSNFSVTRGWTILD